MSLFSPEPTGAAGNSSAAMSSLASLGALQGLTGASVGLNSLNTLQGNVNSKYTHTFNAVETRAPSHFGIDFWGCKIDDVSPKLVIKWLKDNKYKVLEWPSKSPDLNHLETVNHLEKLCPKPLTQVMVSRSF